MFTVFTQRELQHTCNSAGEYDTNDVLRTFMSAGSVAGVNCVSMLAFTEMLINFWHPKWKAVFKESNDAGRFAVALLTMILFWFWHAVVLFWVSQSFVNGTLGRGVFLALHITTYVLTAAFTMTISYKSSPNTFTVDTDESSAKRHIRIWVSAALVGALVVGVVGVGTMSGTRLSRAHHRRHPSAQCR